MPFNYVKSGSDFHPKVISDLVISPYSSCVLVGKDNNQTDVFLYSERGKFIVRKEGLAQKSHMETLSEQEAVEFFALLLIN